MSAPGTLHRLQDLEPSVDDFRASVIAGLSARRKTLPCKFFYDAEGSRLFEKICELPEYYPTRTECSILAARADAIAARLGPAVRLLEFGSGAGVKIRLLLAALERPAAYIPVDISRRHLVVAAAGLARDFPRLRVAPVCADYTTPFGLPGIPGLPPGAMAGFFPGSTIGNFTPDEAVGFLAGARRLLGPGAAMIVGVDLPKDESVLHAAYDDAAGVTAAFNLNLLRRINRELGGDFDIAGFAHRALWNAAASRIEMHLVSLARQSVRIGEHRFDFARDETIHTENSYKYDLARFGAMARAAGYVPVEAWTDERLLFSVHMLRDAAPARG